MENTISEFVAFFESSINIADSKGDERIKLEVPSKNLRILKEFLERNMHLEEKCVATEEKKLDVGCKLADTVSGMTSADYKERFKAEYLQTKIRYEKLKAFNTRIEAAGRTDYKPDEVRVPMPKHDCPEDLLIQQQGAMGEYLHILEVRAVIEGIDLTSI